MTNEELQIKSIQKMLLLSSNPMLYPHIMGVFGLIRHRLNNGDPILTDEESKNGSALLKQLEESE